MSKSLDGVLTKKANQREAFTEAQNSCFKAHRYKTYKQLVS